MNNLLNVSETADLSLAEGPLEHAKAAVGGELSMTNDHEGDGDLIMESSQHSPHQVLHHCVVLVLSRAVVSMQRDSGLS